MISAKDFDQAGIYVGRVWRPGIGPSIVRLEGGDVLDISSQDLPTMHDLLEKDGPAIAAREAKGEVVCTLNDLVQK
jgi:Fumarylacetoacetate (FAA) hydrolase family protein